MTANHQLTNLLIEAGLVHGVSAPTGWGSYVQNSLLPLLSHPKLRHHAKILSDGFARSKAPVSVFIVGEGNFGKSTLVNALLGLGQEVAKSDFLPLTWHITRYVPEMNSARFEVHYDFTDASAGRLESLVIEIGGRVQPSHGVINLDRLEQVQQILESEEEARKKQNAKSSIWQVIQSVRHPDVQHHHALEIVDSPGISQMRIGTSSGESIEDYYHLADVVLWVIAADKTNSKATRESLTSLSRYGKPIIGVVNRADLIPENRKSEVINEVQRKYGDILSDIALVSAKQAFQSTINDDDNELEKSGLPSLREKITQISGNSAQRTKTLSLYNTSKQAAFEAASILGKEAQILEKNVDLFHQNLHSASEFSNSGLRAVEKLLRAESGNVASVVRSVLRLTFVPYGEDDVALYDQKALNTRLHQQKRILIEKVNSRLDAELKLTQDKIALRSYSVQSYREDATVKSHDSRTSIKMEMIHVPYQIYEYKLNYELTLTDQILRLFDEIADTFWQFLGHTPTQQEIREKQKQRRSKALNQIINEASDIEDKIFNQIQSEAKSSSSKVAQILKREVETCFNRVFGCGEDAKKKSSEFRTNSSKAIIPPPIVYSISGLLKSVLKL